MADTFSREIRDEASSERPWAQPVAVDAAGGEADGMKLFEMKHRAELDPFEPHYTTHEIAEMWKLDDTTVRRIFQDEPGVFKIGKLGRRAGKRDYITLRIPASVANRVYRQRTA